MSNKTQFVGIRLPVEDYEKLQKLASDHMVNFSVVVRWAVVEYLEKVVDK